MSKQICIPCNQEFPSSKSFEEHKASGHTTTGISLDPFTPVVKIPKGSEPNKEFLEAVKRIEEKEESKIETPAPEVSKPTTKPIVLKYVFTGDCPTHAVTVDTIVVEASGKCFAIAICPVDKEQLQTKEVEKIK